MWFKSFLICLLLKSFIFWFFSLNFAIWLYFRCRAITFMCRSIHSFNLDFLRQPRYHNFLSRRKAGTTDVNTFPTKWGKDFTALRESAENWRPPWSPREGLLTSIWILHRGTLVEWEANLLTIPCCHIHFWCVNWVKWMSIEVSATIQSQDPLSVLVLAIRWHFISHLESSHVSCWLWSVWQSVWVASLFFPRDSLTNKALPGDKC